jgi:hypothetical protein
MASHSKADVRYSSHFGLMSDIAPLPRWAISRHDTGEFRCPLYPRKRTFLGAVAMSALDQYQTSHGADRTAASAMSESRVRSYLAYAKIATFG